MSVYTVTDKKITPGGNKRVKSNLQRVSKGSTMGDEFV